MPCAIDDAFPRRIETIKEIVGGCNIMLFQEIIAEIAARNSGKVVDIGYMVDADKRHLVVEMPSLDFATHDIPKVGIGGFSKQASCIKLGNDGKPFVIGSDVALDAIPNFVCGA